MYFRPFPYAGPSSLPLLCTLPAHDLYGLKCKRAYKHELSPHTQSFESLCPRETSPPRCYFMNCSNGYKTRIDWGCGFVVSSPDQCPKDRASVARGRPFKAEGFACKCQVGEEGVDMSNEHMSFEIDDATPILPPSIQSTSTTATSVPPTSSTENKPPHETTLSLANRRCIIHFTTFIMPIFLCIWFGSFLAIN
uniref:EGF-like domain-containing protein n=1 Tax=Globodera pallida TaxID=36090 RepID=A0A183CHR9_GLOPA